MSAAIEILVPPDGLSFEQQQRWHAAMKFLRPDSFTLDLALPDAPEPPQDHKDRG